MTRSWRGRVFALGLALALGGGATTARANGRFPRAQRLLERNGSPDELVLAATYGLILTDDRGGEWRHVCELGFAFAIDEIDPIVGVFPDGSMLVKGTRSLNHAPQPFCAFEPVLGGAASEVAADFSVDATDRNRALALVLLRGDAGTTKNQLFESTDAGRTFAELGQPLPEDDVQSGLTLDVPASDPGRVYVSATGQKVPAVFVRSDDRGASWTTSALPLGAEEYPYIAAVDPTNADAIYIRTDQWVPNAEGAYEANDALLHSDDGGLGFRELHRAAGKLFGFALSPDGREILVGYGDPVEPSRSVDRAALGIYRASTLDFVFTKIYEGSVSCLAWTEHGLYVCTSQVDVDFALGMAANADFDLATENPFTPLLDLRNVRPLDCPACTSGADCLALWPQTCATFGNCDAGVVVAGSSSTECQDAGAGGAGEGGAAAGGAAGAPKKKSPPRDSSCGCRSATSEGGNGSFLLVAFGVLTLERRRRARRDSTNLSACETRAGRLLRASRTPTARFLTEV